MKLLLLAPMLLATLLTGCATSLDYTFLRSHVVLANAEGDIVDLQTGDPLDEAALRHHIDHILNEAIRQCDQHCEHHTTDKRKLLIHVHGGLNSSDTALEQAQAIARCMEDEAPEDWAYPIFVVWPSGGLDSYAEHAVWLRVGHHEVWGPPTSPIIVTTDVLSGLARSPYTLTLQFLIDCGVGLEILTGGPAVPESRDVESIYLSLCSTINARQGPYHRGALRQAGRLLSYVSLFPVKALTAAIVLDGMGSGAWDVMLRRTHNLFRPPSTYEVSDLRSDPDALRKNMARSADGAMARFMQALRDRIMIERDKYEITLVGHSMGAIVLNRALWAYLDDDLPIENIVYMAPACSIAETEATLVQFLKNHPGTKFHLLTLHRIAEFDEINWCDVVPRGSLLEWIHRWYDVPPVHAERRLGTWESALQAIQIFKGVENQVSIKAFGVEPGSKPQEHGDFNRCPFWQKDFWDPKGPMLYFRHDNMWLVPRAVKTALDEHTGGPAKRAETRPRSPVPPEKSVRTTE